MASCSPMSRLTLLAGAGIASAALVVALPSAALAASPSVVAKPSPPAPTPATAKKAAPAAKKAAPAAASIRPELIGATTAVNPAVGTLMSAARNISAGTAPAAKTTAAPPAKKAPAPAAKKAAAPAAKKAAPAAKKAAPAAGKKAAAPAAPKKTAAAAKTTAVKKTTDAKKATAPKTPAAASAPKPAANKPAAAIPSEVIRATTPVNPTVGTLLSAARNISAGTAPTAQKPAASAPKRAAAPAPKKAAAPAPKMSVPAPVKGLEGPDPKSPFGQTLDRLGVAPRKPTPAEVNAAEARKRVEDARRKEIEATRTSTGTLDGLRWLSPEQKLQSTMAATTRLGQDASPALKATEKKLLAEAKDRARATQNAQAVTALTTMARGQVPTPTQAEALAGFTSGVTSQAQRAGATPAQRSASAVAAQRMGVAVNAQRDRTDGITADALATARQDAAVVQTQRPVVPKGDALCADVNVGVFKFMGASYCDGANYVAGKWREGVGWGVDGGVSTLSEKDAVQGASVLLARAKATVSGVKVGGEVQSRNATDGTWESVTAKTEVGLNGVLKIDGKATVNSQGGGGVGGAVSANDLRMGGMVQTDRPGDVPTLKPELTYRKTEDLGLGAVIFAGTEVVTEVRAKPQPDPRIEDQELALKGFVAGSTPGPDGRLIRPSEQWEIARQEQVEGIRAEQRATNATLAEGFRAAHPAQPMPDAERLRVDRAARAQGVNTEAAAYKRGGWVEQARSQGLDDAAITKLRIDSGMRSGPDGVAAQ